VLNQFLVFFLVTYLHSRVLARKQTITDADVDVSASCWSHKVVQRCNHIKRHVGDVLRMRIAHCRRTGHDHVRVADSLDLSITRHVTQHIIVSIIS